MTIEIFKKLRNELYKISEVEEFENVVADNLYDYSHIVNFISHSKTLRNESESKIIETFIPALKSNKLLAIKSLFYVRNKYYGLGERRVFKVIINYLAYNELDCLKNNLILISKYGRWDDYYALFYTPMEKDVIKLFKHQISIDINSERPSTLGKWLKSENTSSNTSKKLAFRTRKLLGYNSKEYRIILSSLRKKIGIIETNLTSRYYENLDYNEFSLNTCFNYKNTFILNDKENYSKFINSYNINKDNPSYKKNIKKLNQTPYNIIETIINDKNIDSESEKLYDNLWSIVCSKYKDFFQDTYVIVAISDKSFRNSNTAYKIALSTVLFYNTFNSSIYKNYYMYFNTKPRFAKIQSNKIVEQVLSVKNAQFSAPNNIESALDLLLFTSIKKELTNDKIPKNILIISDLNLEEKYKDSNNIQLIKNKWGLSGYIIPKLKFWQLDNTCKHNSINKDIYSNIFAKGYSTEIFTSLLTEEFLNSRDLIIKKVESVSQDISLYGYTL